MLHRYTENNEFDYQKSRLGLLRRVLTTNARQNGSPTSDDEETAPFVQTTCQECTKPIEPDALFCQSCHAPVVRRYCPKCSKLVPENSKFCPFCGAPANAAPRFHKAHIQTIIGVVAGIAFIAYAVVNTTKGTAASKDSAENQLKAKTPAAPAPATAQPVQVGAIVNQSIPSASESVQLNLEAHKLITEQRYAEAIPILQRALQAFPEGSSDITYKYVLYNLGHSLRRVGRFSEAQMYLEKCLVLDSTWDKALSEISIIRAKLTTAPPSAPSTTTG